MRDRQTARSPRSNSADRVSEARRSRFTLGPLTHAHSGGNPGTRGPHRRAAGQLRTPRRAVGHGRRRGRGDPQEASSRGRGRHRRGQELCLSGAGDPRRGRRPRRARAGKPAVAAQADRDLDPHDQPAGAADRKGPAAAQQRDPAGVLGGAGQRPAKLPEPAAAAGWPTTGPRASFARTRSSPSCGN